MNETFRNLLEPNRAEKVGGERGRGKKIPSGIVVNEEISQKEQQPDPLRQCNYLAESSKLFHDESSDEEEDDGTTCNICKIPWIEMIEKC